MPLNTSSGGPAAAPAGARADAHAQLLLADLDACRCAGRTRHRSARPAGGRRRGGRGAVARPASMARHIDIARLRKRVIAMPQAIITYSPGAATPGGCLRLPSFFGAATSAPERCCIQAIQCGHQLPSWRVAPAAQASGSGRRPWPRRRTTSAEPGGLSRLCRWPALASTNSLLLAVDARRLVARLPRRDVVGDAGDDVGIDIDLAHVDRLAQHLHLAGVDVRVVLEDAEQVGMEGRRQARGVGVPEQDVEGRRVVAEQVVVDPVVPDQVVRAQPGEDARHLGAVDDALALDRRLQRLAGSCR